MATNTLPMNKVREIIKLLETGMKERAIARAVVRSRSAVRYVKQQATVARVSYDMASKMDDETLKAHIYPARQEKPTRKIELDKMLPDIVQKLGKKHETLEHLWEKYRENNLDGYQYSRFCHYVSLWIKQDDVCMALHHEYGDMMFVDFAGKKLHIIDRLTGEKKEVEVFIAVLPASQYTYVECRMSQAIEDWIPANENAIRFYGGAPAGIVPDCLKSAVTKAHRYESEKNPQYKQFADYYDTVILPARPYHPKDKALAENTVNNVYRYIYPRILEQDYYSLGELNAALLELVKKYNKRIMKAYGCSRQELFESHEQAVLKALPRMRYEFKKYQAPRSVSYSVYVFLKEDKHYYSIPMRHRRKKISIFYTSSTVELHCNNIRIAVHKREKGIKRFTTNPDHIPKRHQEYLKWNPQTLTAWASSTGEHVCKIVKSIIEQSRHPFEAIRSCLYILSLSKKYGNVRLESACKRALRFGALSGSKIERILKNNSDLLPDEQQTFEDLPEHENIRGSEYYDRIPIFSESAGKTASVEGL